MKKNISILGSTGTIGRKTLEIVEIFSDKFHVIALSAGENIPLLLEQIKKFNPKFVSVKKREDAISLMEISKKMGFEVLWGIEGAVKISTLYDADLIVSAISGIDGFIPTFEAVKAGKSIALANKESLVMGGALIKKEADKNLAFIIPIDSEHNALFQLLEKKTEDKIKRYILTASGGPFFKKREDELKNVSIEEVLNHPVWRMGKKISVDSATLMNKGLELIEAHWLFSIPPESLDVIIHPQSIVHALVELKDGSFIGFLSIPEMKIPIQHALFHPEAPEISFEPLSFEKLNSLEFYPVDYKKFPCFSLALYALKEGESFPTVLAVANEVAVNKFLEGELEFLKIPVIIEKVMNKHKKIEINSFEDIIKIKEWAEKRAIELVKQLK
ncbi:MAG: 1-deoxy-D-xylulose-5-phosphate reductoisomerase [Candidatus Aminicenantia bacterium]